MKILKRTNKTILSTAVMAATMLSSLSMATPVIDKGAEIQGDGPWPMLLSYEDKADVLAIKEQHDFWKIDEKNKTVLMQIESFDEYQLLTKEGFALAIEPELMKQYSELKNLSFDEIKTIDGFACYHTVAEIYQKMTDMQSNNPTLVELVDIGDSWHKVNPGGDAGHDIQVVKITNQNNVVADKPVLYAMGSIHSREYPPAELVTRFAEYLLSEYGQNADVTWLVDHHEIHLLLIGNPDGRIKSENQPSPIQRKNRNENHCFSNGDGTSFSHQGVDMNRNFEFMWNQGSGSSSDHCSQGYRGTGLLSEPETQAVDTYISTLFTDDRPNDLVTAAPLTKMGVYLDIHNVAELTLFPWGFDNNIGQAPNHDQLQTLARRMSFYTGYRAEQSNDTLGGADGASDDNAYGKLGVAAYTIELGADNTFYSSCNSFENTILPDNLQAMIYAAKASRQPYIISSGPTIENLPTMAVEGASGQNLNIQGLATDLNFYQNNGTESTQNITSVQAYVGTPPWENGATAVAMSAQDGSFNSKSEAFTGQMPLSGLSSGKHVVWLTATDTSGITGVPSAFFVDVVNPGDLGTLSGTVSESGSNAPIELAQINYDGLVASTNASGYFEIQATARTADLMVSKAGYESMTFNGVSILGQQTTTQNAQLLAKCGDISNDLNAYSSFNDAVSEGWSAAANPGSSDWRIESNSGVSNSAAFVATDVGETTDKYLVSPEVTLEQNATLNFWHKHDFESGNAHYDGGVIEISTNQGSTWTDLGSNITQNGYNGTLGGQFGQPLGAVPAFVATLGSFQEVSVNLSSFNSQAVKFRWRMGLDESQGQGDWVIDDISVTNFQSCVIGNDLIFEHGFETP